VNDLPENPSQGLAGVEERNSLAKGATGDFHIMEIKILAKVWSFECERLAGKSFARVGRD